MAISKAWEWSKGTNSFWLEPSEESYYLSNRWIQQGYRSILDFGSGLGRHAIYFAKQGFDVSAFDLSEDGTTHLTEWAQKEGVQIDVKNADMLCLPYKDNSFDCIFAYHVISHTDTKGMRAILAEISRVLKPGGEIFLSLCSKESWSFKDAGYPKLDQNTIIKTEEGPENGIPHFYVTLEDAMDLFDGYELVRIRHIDDGCYPYQKHSSKHYFILARR